MFFPPTFASLLSLSGGSVPPDPYTGHKYFDVDDRTSDGWAIYSGSGYVSGGKWLADSGSNQVLWSPQFAWSAGKNIRAEFPDFQIGGFVELQWDSTIPSNQGITVTRPVGPYLVYIGGNLAGGFSPDGSFELSLEIISDTQILLVAKDAGGITRHSEYLTLPPGSDRFIVKIKSPASGGDTACEQIDYSY